jgi:hypothetical protein
MKAFVLGHCASETPFKRVVVRAFSESHPGLRVFACGSDRDPVRRIDTDRPTR